MNSSDSCNHGTLGNNDGSPEFAVHSGLNYSYSGYHGGQTEATYGHEFVALAGTTNLPLEMRAFGYAAGTANIQYQYVNTARLSFSLPLRVDLWGCDPKRNVLSFFSSLHVIFRAHLTIPLTLWQVLRGGR